MADRTKYYSKLKRPNNEYGKDGKMVYESQLNKSFNFFLFTTCRAVTLTDIQNCYVEIVFDMEAETREIKRITFNTYSLAGKSVSSAFKERIKEYYSFSLDDDVSVEEAMDFIYKVLLSASDYVSTLWRGKPRADEFYMLHPYSSNEGEIGIERGYESPIIRITQDDEKREIIEIGTNEEGYDSFMTCYLDDFMRVMRYISPTYSNKHKAMTIRQEK